MAKFDKAEWTPVGYDGGAYRAGPFRIVLHTTEGPFGPSLSEFRQRFAPHFMVSEDRILQFIDTDRAARALENRPGGVETNRLSAIQIEMVAYAGKPKSQKLLLRVRELLRDLEKAHQVPRVWPNGYCRTAIGGADPGMHNRSVQGWLKAGYFGHEHVPENIHWDPALSLAEIATLMNFGETVGPQPPKTYVVKPGDTLWTIAQAQGLSMAQLGRWNGLKEPNKLAIGQVLRLDEPK